MTPIRSGIEAGIEWAIVRAPLYGAINGYAKLPEGHQWLGKDYDDIDVDVHGGLTYSNGTWIGFDTLHAGDYWPGVPYSHPSDRTWTEDDVEKEVRSLAQQIAEAHA